MTDPLTDIEDRKGQQDLGRIAYRIYQGARDDGATRPEATMIVFAWYLAGFRNADTDAD